LKDGLLQRKNIFKISRTGKRKKSELSMKKFEDITSRVIPLPVKDVDTDMIIPAQFLTSISREGFGQNLFRRLRDSDPNFPLNLPQYQGAQILLADSNFGCGSSREHAVWALLGAGIRVVLCKSFADIFFGNSAKNGLLLISLPAEVIDRMLAEASAGDYQVGIRLDTQQVVLPGGETLHFDYDPFRKFCLLNGHDDIDYILSRKKEIDEFRSQQDEHRFFSTLTPNN
jgi:3-isopropylmalate/(R)-2-methylmalate dehydratase small subunit